MHTRQSILATIAEFCEPRKLVPTPDTVFRHNDFDSLDLVELNMFLEDRYGISIPDDTVGKWTTVDSVIDTVIAALPATEVDTVGGHPCGNCGGTGAVSWDAGIDVTCRACDGTGVDTLCTSTGVAEGTIWVVPAPDGGHPILMMPKSTDLDSTIRDILTEFHAATANFPQWPTDPLHALAVVQEEVGEVQKEVLQLTYEPHKSSVEKVRKEAIQMAARSLRFLLSLDAYKYAPGEQHEQQQ